MDFLKGFCLVLLLIGKFQDSACDFAALVELSSAIYGQGSLTCGQVYTYAANLNFMFHQDVTNQDQYLSDSMVEVSHMVDYMLSKLESVTQSDVMCLYDVADELAVIANDMLSSTAEEICLFTLQTGCSLNPSKAIELIRDTEESLLRIANIIVTDTGVSEAKIVDKQLTVVAVKGSVGAVSKLHKIGGILELPTPKQNASLEMEIVVFVIANKKNMYSFVQDSTFLNEGTVRTFVRNMQGEYMEIFDEINFFVEASNKQDIYKTPNTSQASTNTNDDDLEVTSQFESDLDGGIFLVAIASLKQCSTTLRNKITGENYTIVTKGTDTIISENTTDDVTVSFANQTLQVVLLPPMHQYFISVFCESCIKTADLVFIADGSGSVGATNFESMKEFMSNLVNRVQVGPSAVRIGLMTYGDKNVYEFNLNTYSNAHDVTTRIMNTSYGFMPYTDTGYALRGARVVMFGVDGRQVQRLAVVITDGISTDKPLSSTESDNLRQDGVEVVAIGVGQYVDMAEIAAMADSEYHMFATEFGALNNISENMINTICKGKWSNHETDSGGFGLLSGFALDDVANAWKRSPALQLKSLVENTVVFKSDFFGTFGFNLFAKPPETINFDKVFTNIDDKILETPHVLALNCALLVALIVGTVVLRRYDKKDENMWKYRSLPENPANAQYVYFISLHTGIWSSSIFKSTPFITLSGWYGDSGIRALTSGSFQGLYKWKFANFALSTEDHLGPLTEIKIWYDDQTETERLYIEKILVADAADSVRYAFLCEDWLAVDRADGCTYRTLFPARSELQDGKTLFSSITRFNMFDDYLWLSMLSRPSFSRFTRVQRLYAVSSMISLSMLGSSMWFNTKSDGHIYGISIGPLNINYMQIYIGVMSSLISLPSSLLMAAIFRNRCLRGEWKQSGTARFRMNITSGAFFSWPFTFLGFGIGFAGIGSGMFFTTLYSLQWGSQVTEEWLLSLLFGTSGDVMFIAPLKVVLASLVLAAILKGVAKRNILEMAPFEIEDSGIFLGNIAPTQWPGDKDVSTFEKEHRKRLLLDRKLFKLLSGMALELLFIAMLALICSHNRVEKAYLQNTQLLRLLQPNKQINNTEDIWNWLNDRYIPKVFPKLLYNGKPRLPPERKLMEDDVSYRMGPVRLRQQRVKGNCSIPGEMKVALNVCMPSFSDSNKDTDAYCPGWTAYLSKCKDDGFTFTPKSATSALPYYGIYHTYGGDGYIKDLNPFKGEIKHEIDKLKQGDWIDGRTRFLVVDIIIMNVNSKLFSSISITFEFPTVGAIVTGSNLQTARLYPYIDVWDYIVLLAQLIFILITFVRSILIIYDIWTLRWDCLTSLMFYATFSSIVFSVAAIVCYIIRIDRTIYIVEKIFNSADEFLSFEIVQLYDDVYRMTIGAVLFIAILVMLKSLSFNYYLYMMRAAIIITKSDMMSFSVLLAIPMTAFACITHLYMGSYSYAFRNMLSSFLSLFRTLLAMVKFKDLFGGASAFDSELIFSFFIFIMTIVLMNMFICILNDGFSYVKERGGNLTELEPFDTELNKHFWFKVQQLFSCFNSGNPKNKYEKDDRDNLDARFSGLEQRLGNDANDDLSYIKAVFQMYSRDGK